MMGVVQSQRQRDAKSVTIFAGVLLGAAVLVGGMLLLWIADEMVGLRTDVASALFFTVQAATVIVVVAYVARFRHR